MYIFVLNYAYKKEKKNNNYKYYNYLSNKIIIFKNENKSIKNFFLSIILIHTKKNNDKHRSENYNNTVKNFHSSFEA